jgi:hypothetical protein
MRDTFRQNDYRTLNPTTKIVPPNGKPNSRAFLPYVRPIFNHISRVLSQHNIKSAGLHPRKISSFL